MASVKTSSDNSNANAKQTTDESYLKLSPASNGHVPANFAESKSDYFLFALP